MIRMSTMTFLSLIGHIVAMISLLMLAMINPMPKKKPRPRRRVNVQLLTPVPATPQPTKVQTPKPTPVKTKVIRNKTPTPTPKKTKTPRPKKTKTPTPRKTKTPKKTKTPTPKKTKTPRPTPTKRRTVPPTPTPRRTTPAPESTPLPGTSISTQKGPLDDYPYYEHNAAVIVERHFSRPVYKQTQGIRCRVKFTIMRDGQIANIIVTRSTGDSTLDGRAVAALKRAQLPPFPDVLKNPYIQVEWEFDFSPK